MHTREDLLEGTNRLLQRNELALETSEDLRDLERLRHETLDLTSTLDLVEFMSADAIFEVVSTYGKLVLLRQLVHTQNGNNILERLVVLEDLLDSGSNLVVLLADL